MLMQRLRELDRKVLRDDVRRTPEQWQRFVRRWWWPLAGLAVAIVGDLAVRSAVGGYGNAGLPLLCVLFAFQAGRLKAEHDRLEGRDPFARIRPLED
jgi:hypothetical protein